jgi:3-oxoacyl-[acyl-carrier protein] reductase
MGAGVRREQGGFGSAKALVEDGVNVVINARTDAALQEAAAQLRAVATQWAGTTGRKAPEVLAVACDITTEAGRAAVFSVPGGPGKDYDIVVTNAGGPSGRFPQLGPRRLAQGRGRQYADPHRADQGHGGWHGRARLWPHRQHHLQRREGAHRHPGPVQRARSGLTGFVAGVARSGIAAKG